MKKHLVISVKIQSDKTLSAQIFLTRQQIGFFMI